MILPTKHIPFERSVLGSGASLLRLLNEPQTVTQAWDRARVLPEVATYPRFVLALDFLHAVGAVKLERGLLVRSER